jgi:hypothetical protein
LQRIEAVRRWISLGLSQDGGWTDFDDILGVNCLKGGLSIVTTVDPCYFSLVTLFKSTQKKDRAIVNRISVDVNTTSHFKVLSVAIFVVLRLRGCALT